MGTLLYLAPEYIVDNVIAPQMDVYQVGITLIELLTGRHPITAENDAQALVKIMNGDLSIPEGLIRSPLGPVLRNAVTMDMHRRYPSAVELRAALQQVDLGRLHRDWSLGVSLPGTNSPRQQFRRVNTRMLTAQIDHSHAPAHVPTLVRVKTPSPDDDWSSSNSLEFEQTHSAHTPNPHQLPSKPFAPDPRPEPMFRVTGLLVGILLGVAVLLVLVATFSIFAVSSLAEKKAQEGQTTPQQHTQTHDKNKNKNTPSTEPWKLSETDDEPAPTTNPLQTNNSTDPKEPTNTEQPETETPDPLVPPNADQDNQPPDDEVQKVDLTIEAKPKSALISTGENEVLGSGKAVVSLTSDDSIDVRIEAPGYKSKVVSLTAKQAPHIKVVLEAKGRTATKQTRRRRRSAGTRTQNKSPHDFGFME